jgi:N-acetyl-anhydromuramyl-L-alanine amidase AmpD
MKEYNIPANAVVRHSDVSGDDVRGKGKGKTDPGSAFDWDRFKQQLVT